MMGLVCKGAALGGSSKFSGAGARKMRTALLCAATCASLFLQGCATCKGAAEGFKEDWKALGQADEWMRENLW